MKRLFEELEGQITEMVVRITTSAWDLSLETHAAGSSVNSAYWEEIRKFWHTFHNRHFSQTQKVEPLIPSLYPMYLQFSSLFGSWNVSKAENRCHLVKVITFQRRRLDWFFWFCMIQPKQSWLHWHSCIVKRSWKTLMVVYWENIWKYKLIINTADWKIILHIYILH